VRERDRKRKEGRGGERSIEVRWCGGGFVESTERERERERERWKRPS
jgi:hypothetical protein